MPSPLFHPVLSLQKQFKKTKTMVKKGSDLKMLSALASSTPSTPPKLLDTSTTSEKLVDTLPHDEDARNAHEEKKDNEDEDEAVSQHEVYMLPDITKNPLDEIAMTAAALGATFGFGVTALLVGNLSSAPIYLMALSIFHFLEFWVTAKYNPTRVHSESFIINNGSAYTLAHTFALLECAVEYYLFTNLKVSFRYLKFLGFALVVGGQFVRTLAMKTAGKSFNHLVQHKRADDHELVTTGIYSYFRHPSYFGFFWWAIGTQLLLLNPLSLIGFFYVLYTFFSDRIFHEEQFLIKFFGQDYVTFKAKTPTYIPFIA